MGKKARKKREARDAAKVSRHGVVVAASPFSDVRPGEHGRILGKAGHAYRVGFADGRVHLFWPHELTNA